MLRRISGLDALVCLERLLLKANRITAIENVGSLQALRHLNLSGNSIRRIADLALTSLAKLPHLEGLQLQILDGGLANPVCRSQNYRQEIISGLPELRILDGKR